MSCVLFSIRKMASASASAGANNLVDEFEESFQVSKIIAFNNQQINACQFEMNGYLFFFLLHLYAGMCTCANQTRGSNGSGKR